MKLPIAHLSIPTVFCIGATLLSVNASAEQASDAGCRTAWNNSSAASKCEAVKIVANAFNCEVSARCRNDNGTLGETTKVASDFAYTHKLIVEGGVLKLSRNAEFESRAYPRD